MQFVRSSNSLLLDIYRKRLELTIEIMDFISMIVHGNAIAVSITRVFTPLTLF